MGRFDVSKRDANELKVVAALVLLRVLDKRTSQADRTRFSVRCRCGEVAVALVLTFLVRLDGITDEFGGAMVCILARSSRTKIPMARTNEYIFLVLFGSSLVSWLD